MAFTWLHPTSIVVDWKNNPREQDASHVHAIAAHMNEHGYDEKQYIIVYELTDIDDGCYYAATGHHRLAAATLQDDEFPNLPLEEVFCEILQGTRREYYRRILIDNFQHTPGFNSSLGKMPTRRELRTMRYRLLFFPDNFAKGDRLLAKEWGCDNKSIGALRDAIIKDFGNGNNPIHSNIHASYVSDDDIVQIKAIIDEDLYIGIDGKKRPRTTATYKPTTERSTEEKSTVEKLEGSDKPKSDIEQAKIDHSNARLRVQSAFFGTNLDKLDTEFPNVETGKKLNKFFALIVEEKGLRFNIFSHDYRFVTKSKFGLNEEIPDIYKGRNLEVSEIREEIEVIDQIAKDINFYMQGDEFHIGWVEQVIEKFKSSEKPESESAEETAETSVEDDSPESESEQPDSETTEQEDNFKAAVKNAETRLSWMWDSFDSSEIAKHLSREEFALVVAQQFNWYIENDYGSGENYMLEKDFALLKNLGSVGDATKWRKRFDTVQDALHRNETWITALIPEAAAEPPVSTTAETSVEDANAEALQHLQKAQDRMWSAFDEAGLANKVSKDAFVNAACLGNPNWGVAEFPKLEEADIPQIWEARFELIVTEIKVGSGWITELIDGNHAPDESKLTFDAKLADILGEDTLEFITVCLRNPAEEDSDKKGKLQYITFEGERDSMTSDPLPLSKIPEDLLLQLIEIAKEHKRADSH